MYFRITRHSGYAAPPDAIELLARRLGTQRSDISFAVKGAEIRARWDGDTGRSATRDNLAEIGRWVVFELVREVCEDAPELETDWFAVSRSQ